MEKNREEERKFDCKMDMSYKAIQCSGKWEAALLGLNQQD